MRAEQGPCEPIKGCIYAKLESNSEPESARELQWEPERAIESQGEIKQEQKRASESQSGSPSYPFGRLVTKKASLTSKNTCSLIQGRGLLSVTSANFAAIEPAL